MRIAIGQLLAVLPSGSASLAADPRYPDWPCTQAKVPGDLARCGVGRSRRSMTPRTNGRTTPRSARWWPGWRARRTPLEEAQKAITEFLAGSAADKATAGKLLFAGLFDTLNAQRSSVMNGLERVTRKQREAAEKIRDDTLALQALQGASPPDQTKIDELGNQLVWETRIFEDRRQVVQIRLRGADRDRPAAVRARPHHPAGNGIAEPALADPFCTAIGEPNPSGCLVVLNVESRETCDENSKILPGRR